MNQTYKENSPYNSAGIPEYIADRLNAASPEHISALVVDLRIVRDNYRRINFLLKKSNIQKCISACVLKANAYGLGDVEIAKTLTDEGCRDFFVSDITEGVQMRTFVPKDANIYVLCGVLPKTEEILYQNNLVPVLIDRSQVEDWNAYAEKTGLSLPAILHFDTGMTRTGLSWQDTLWYLNRPDIMHNISIKYIMSHLTCSDNPHSSNNLTQLTKFRRFKRLFPSVKASFSNSKGILHGAEYHFDMVRIGTFLFGLTTRLDNFKPTMQPMSLYAKILNINNVPPNCSVGYGASYVCNRFSRIATIGLGYADGIFRNLSKNGGEVIIGGIRAKMVGRISMDLITVDVTDVPEHLTFPGQWCTVCSPEMNTEEISDKMGTISLEFSCNLGNRLHRIYIK